MQFLRKYLGVTQHGYWSYQWDRKLHYDEFIHGQEPEEFYKYGPIIKWWVVRCELDFYRMIKEYSKLKDKPTRLELA